MSVVYRSVFTDPRPQLIEDGRTYFSAWLQSKNIRADLPQATGSFDDPNGLGVVSVIAAQEGDTTAVRLRLDEDRAAERWSSTLTLIVSGEEQWVWIDVERVSDDAFGVAPLVAPPRIVQDFLSTSETFAGTTHLRAECSVVDESGVDALVAELLDPGRTVPIVVASRDPDYPGGARERGEALIRVVRGVANVWALEGYSTSELSKHVGSDLHVFHGAVRTYLPGLSVPDRNPRRHRFAGRDLFIGDPRRGARVLGRSLLMMATSARPPAVYRDVVRNMPGFTRQGADPVALLADLVGAEAQIDDLKQALESAYLEAQDAAVEAARARARARWLESELASNSTFLTGLPTPGEDEIVTVTSCEEALIYADAGLSYVIIGDTAEPAEAIDRHSKGPIWARKAWDSFQALQSYAIAKSDGSFQGNFLTYCQSSSPLGHRIPADWVALHETELVDNNPTYRSARVFPVSVEVDPAGEVYMDQHIRLEKGSDPAPRIHYHDDTAGATGCIYVGYLGRHLPSDQSN